MNELKTVIHNHNVNPHKPGHLCVSSSSTLLYQDVSEFPCEVHMLDCSGSRSKPVQGKNVIRTQQNVTSDMYVVQDSDNEFLIATDSGAVVGRSGEICAYNTATDELEWSVKGKLEGMMKKMDPRGVTTDGRGHLFICDTNNECIQMFSIRDGSYMGAVMKRGLRDPYLIQWCEVTLSLVINYTKDNQECIGVINVT